MLPALGEAADLDLEKDLQEKLFQSKKIIETIREKQKTGGPTLQEATRLKSLSEDIAASHLLLTERFRLRDEKVKGMSGKARERHSAVKEGYTKALEEYLALVNSLVPEGGSQKAGGRRQEKILDNIKTLLDKILHKKKLPILGSLPYKHLNYPAQLPGTAPVITPAYRGGSQTVSSDDTKGTPEAPISLDIANLAQSLSWSPVSIYEYVKNNVETEWYWGCQKGAEETLRQKSGNDCDQAALLVSLLRASNYPTRYVRGAIEFFPDIEKATNLTGVSDPAKLGEFFQKAGIPHEVVMDGTFVKNVRIEHIYVESLIPYSNYRGAIMDDQGKIWLGLDTSMKVKGYTFTNPLDIASEYPLANIWNEYLGFSQPAAGNPQLVTPLEYIQAYLNAQLANSHPGTSYTDYLSSRTLNSEVMQILPSTLQFKAIAITNEYTRIPDDLIHKVSFSAKDVSNTELFSITLETHKLSNHKVIISYEPESVDDQETISQFGGLDNTPAYMVHLRPTLLIDDERVIIATDGVAMGGDYDLTIELRGPGGTETFTNAMISGNMTAIGIVSQKAAVPTGIDEQKAANLLYREALRYIDNWNKGEEELASLLRVAVIRLVPTIVTLGNTIDVTYVLDQPHGFEWKGVFLDADVRAIETVDGRQDTVDRGKLFMQLSALQGSVLESKLFEDAFGVGSISTAKLFGLANGSQPATPILSIDQTNINDILPTLPFDDNIKQDITEAVAQNSTVRIPNSELIYEDWTGVGYIKENTTTGEAGYMLSGMTAGGMTAVSPLNWPNQSFVDVLNKPYRENNKRIMITSPQNESTVSYSPITVTGIVLDPNATVAVNGVSAYVEGNTFTAGGVKLSPWENLISADSVSTTGVASHDSIAVTYKIPLQVAVTFPYDNSNLAVTPIFIEGAVSDPTASVTVNNVKATVLADGRFTATGVSLYEGANPITVTATNRVGETATQTVTLNYHATTPQPSLSVSITSPTSGATINNETVTVSGTVTSSAQEMSVRVNGVLAEIYNGQFNANNVPLTEGSNIIIADALDANGAIARAQITITANTAAPHVNLSSNIQSGVAPLTTYFSVKTSIQNPITSYQLDFGDGSALYTGTTFDNVSHTYTAEGVIHPVLTVTDSQGNAYTATTTITIQNKTWLNSLLTSKWNTTKNALLNSDIAGALTNISEDAKDMYRYNFELMQDYLSQIAQDMGDIQMVRVGEKIAVFETFRNDDGAQRSYYVEFMRGPDGMWQLSFF